MMRLGLSSAAAPDASMEDLIEGCVRRGLGALELEAGHAHGVAPLHPAIRRANEARALAAAAGLAIAGYRVTGAGAALTVGGQGNADAGDLLALGLSLGAPILADPPTALELSAGRVRGGTEVMAVLEAGSGAITALDTLGASGRSGSELPLAWDLDPGAGDVSEVAAEVLGRAAGRIRHVRMLGGGPESTLQEGRGIGSLMVRLTLAGFGGTLALAPSTERHRVIWSAWLGRRGGWGCGSKTEDRELVTLVSP